MSRIVSAFLIACLLSSAAPCPAFSADASCVVVAVKGRALATDAQNNERTLRPEDALTTGETIETGPGGYVDLSLDPQRKNITRIEENTKAVLRSLDPGTIDIVEGSIFAKLRALPKKSEFQVETPIAIAVVRGSAYRTSHAEGEGTKVYNYSNSPVYVYAKNADGKAEGEPAVLSYEEKTEVKNKGEAPAEPKLMSTAEKEGGSSDLSALEDYDQDKGGATGGAGSGEEEAKNVLREMARAYEAKDLASFISHVSPDYSYLGEMEEFARRDFRDYADMRIKLFFKHVTPSPQGYSVQADWEMQVFPTALDVPIRVRGDNSDFVFDRRGETFVMTSMRGGHPLFAGRSPDIASLSGVPAGIVQLLEQLSDSGTRQSRQSAIILITSDRATDIDPRTAPTDIEILPPTEVYNTVDESDESITGIGPVTPVQPFINVRFLSNPLNVTLSNVLLEVTDSQSGQVLRGRGTLIPGRINRIQTQDSISIPSVTSGTFTYVVDPDREFSFIDRNNTRTTASYTAL